MPGPSDPSFDTLALHAGAAPDPATGARATPIHLTTSFVFESSEHAASLFNMERAGHVYSRISNPTTAVLEERVAALEGGIGAIATASGQAALHLAIATIAGAGSHVVASTALYGGSHNLLAYTLSRFGIETSFVKPRDIDAWRAAIRPNTRLLFGESLGNPGLDVLDIPRVAAIAHDAGLPLRMERHVANARKVARFLAAHPLVAQVGYPELESHPDHALAKELLPRGCGSVFSFDLRGSRAQGVAFIEALQLFSHLANVGDCRSLVIHPASTTHFRMDDAALAAAGIGPGTIRLSIGLEDADDLIADLKAALKAAERAAP